MGDVAVVPVPLYPHRAAAIRHSPERGAARPAPRTVHRLRSLNAALSGRRLEDRLHRGGWGRSAGAQPTRDGTQPATPEALDLIEARFAQRAQLGVHRDKT